MEVDIQMIQIPATKAWLASNFDPIFGFPSLVRFSWSTAEKILDEKAAPVDWEDPDEEEDMSVVPIKISSFFAKSPAKTKENVGPIGMLFSLIRRCLSNTVEF